MKLTKLIIRNFRKLNNVEISFENASFLIGANNTGKSSVLKAIDILLNLDSKIENIQSKYIDEAGTERIEDEDTIIEGEFHNLPHNILDLRGFNKNRIFKDAHDDYFFCYRVRIEPNGKQHREIKMREVEVKEEFKTPQEYINAGINASYFTKLNLKTKIPKIFQLGDISNLYNS